MKKTYEKPMIYIESFKLSQDISAGCLLITEGKENSPVYDPEIDMTYLLDYSNCTDTPPNGYDELCYHVATFDNKIFAS